MRPLFSLLESVGVAVVLLVLIASSVFGVEILNQAAAGAILDQIYGKVNEQPEVQSKEYIFPYALVTKVTDGDTLTVETTYATSSDQPVSQRIEYKVRLIGINTPETVDPRKAVECFGKEASAKAKEILDGKVVKLELDSSQDKFDRYGRLLAYVYVQEREETEEIFFNKYMIENGYAHEYTYESPYVFQSEFKRAQAEAETAKRGLWSDSGVGGGCN